ALRAVAPGAHHLAARPARDVGLAAAGVRLRRAAHVLAGAARLLAVARSGRAGAADLLVRGADILPRAPGLLRHPPLRHVGRGWGGLAAGTADAVAADRALAGVHLRRGAGGEAQRLVPAAGAARPRVAGQMGSTFPKGSNWPGGSNQSKGELLGE